MIKTVRNHAKDIIKKGVNAGDLILAQKELTC